MEGSNRLDVSVDFAPVDGLVASLPRQVVDITGPIIHRVIYLLLLNGGASV